MQGFQEGEFQVGVSSAASGSIPLSLQPLYTLISENSNFFPPIYYQKTIVVPHPGSVVLAYPVLSGNLLNYPLFVVNPAERSAAFLAYGIWRLQLMSPVSGLSQDFLKDFLKTVLRTVLTSGNQRLLSVHTDRKIYAPSENIRFSSLLVDQSGVPVSSATVDVSLIDDASLESVANFELAPRGDGGYSASTAGIGAGKYTFVAKALQDGQVVGVDSGSVVVAPLNREFLQPSMNAQLLEQIAALTGGKFMTAQEFEKGNFTLDPEMKRPVALSTSHRFEVLTSLPLLGLVILLLGIEWVTRKIWGLP